MIPGNIKKEDVLNAIDEIKFADCFKKYINACNNTDWLKKHEIYKFRFAHWLHRKINFDTQSDEDIKKICEESQKQTYRPDSKEKGINFILAQKRYQDEIISLDDIRILRNLYKGVEPDEELFKDVVDSFPVFSVWLSTLVPKYYYPLANKNLIDSLAYLYNVQKYPKRGYKSFTFSQELLRLLRNKLEENEIDLNNIYLPLLKKDKLEDIDWVWITQDFNFFAYKQVLSINFWVFQASPKIYNVVEALKDNALKTWSVTAHKDKIKKDDKVILWVTGDNTGCYALCTVDSDIENRLDDEEEQKYYTDRSENIARDRVSLKIDCNLWDKPILKSDIEDVGIFENFKGGNQGTNFTATKEQYEELSKMAKTKSSIKYWLYAPGNNAFKWEEFYNSGIMAIGWDDLGNLKQFRNKEEISRKLMELYNLEGSPTNDTLACYEFCNTLKTGDIIIPKQGQYKYLGYGIVKSDYHFDDSRSEFKSTRKVDWIKKGEWLEEKGPIVVKTLTDITKYPEYVERLKSKIGIGIEKISNIIKEFIRISNNQITGQGVTTEASNFVSEISANKYADLEVKCGFGLGRATNVPCNNSFLMISDFTFRANGRNL